MGRSVWNMEVARTAQELVNSAIRLRLQAVLALGRFYATAAFPDAHLSSGTFVRGYEQLTGLVANFRRDSAAARICSASREIIAML